ncbi:MAG: hypothetical protein ACLQUW_16520 [Desulfobaccales bacterium]
MATLVFILGYEVTPGGNVAAGLPRLELLVLSPIWRGETLILDYPDGESHTLVGWQGEGAGGPCPLRVFWTRHQPGTPACATLPAAMVCPSWRWRPA